MLRFRPKGVAFDVRPKDGAFGDGYGNWRLICAFVEDLALFAVEIGAFDSVVDAGSSVSPIDSLSEVVDCYAYRVY